MRSLGLALGGVLVLAGCSTIADTDYQMIRVETPGVIGAKCTLKTRNSQYSVITPGTVQVDRSDETMEVLCKKAHFYPAWARIPSSAHGATSFVRNLPTGPFPLTTAYDVASNSVYHYPATVSIPMQPDPYAVAAASEEEEMPEPPRKKERALPKKDEDPVQPASPPDESMAEEVLQTILVK